MTVLVKLSVVKLVTREEDFKSSAQALNLRLVKKERLGLDRALCLKKTNKHSREEECSLSASVLGSA